jgi:hypothetical protein
MGKFLISENPQGKSLSKNPSGKSWRKILKENP